MVDEDKTVVRAIPTLAKPKDLSRDQAYFIVIAGGTVGMMHKLPTDGDAVIGRAFDAQVRLEDEGVSRHHAKVKPSIDGIPVIEDMGSTNGTFVNGSKIDKHKLKDGDKVQIGSTCILKFSFQDDIERSFQEELFNRGVRDGLTNIYNKKYFLERIETECAHSRRHKQPLTLVMFDIDHFKKINDTHGHPAGDYSLKQLAKLVVKNLRTDDIFARYGGEEFVVLMRNIDEQGALILAERVRRSIEGHRFEYESTHIPITISLGIGQYTDDIKGPKELIDIADKYLYKAKEGGRNRVECKAVETP